LEKEKGEKMNRLKLANANHNIQLILALVWKQGSDKCPICGKIGVPIECPVNLGVECPECGPVFFDLFKQGFYEQDTVKEASRLKKEGRHERKT
jgi:hypothetical protein